jgi:hypothetical protein
MEFSPALGWNSYVELIKFAAEPQSEVTDYITAHDD